jgi:hypothetical protein
MKGTPMPARTTRQEARARLQKMFATALDRLVPQDESVPLKGRVFLDFENQVDEVGKPLLAAMMEERAALDAQAAVEQAGRCPRCGSERTYLEKTKPPQKREIISPNGPVLVEEESCRCRKCNRAFSPSDQSVGAAH